MIEDYWQAVQRLAQEACWYLFEHDGHLYIFSYL